MNTGVGSLETVMSWSRDGLEAYFYCLGLNPDVLVLVLRPNVLVLVLRKMSWYWSRSLSKFYLFFISAISEYSTGSSSAHTVVQGVSIGCYAEPCISYTVEFSIRPSVRLNDLECLFRVKLCFRAGLAGSDRATFEK